ncbi:hypothetical protein NDU88_002388 [Pleurodeles waltl]|uniref:Uncharacterized protein n=1 Tax=Pleurodeles waltl TaxID=8319 RepID=A0AAV7NFB5_PLEWA|nr:hypothetical protein NDU88_002388 [Pleurodeles waltl]
MATLVRSVTWQLETLVPVHEETLRKTYAVMSLKTLSNLATRDAGYCARRNSPEDSRHDVTEDLKENNIHEHSIDEQRSLYFLVRGPQHQAHCRLYQGAVVELNVDQEAARLLLWSQWWSQELSDPPGEA